MRSTGRRPYTAPDPAHGLRDVPRGTPEEQGGQPLHPRPQDAALTSPGAPTPQVAATRGSARPHPHLPSHATSVRPYQREGPSRGHIRNGVRTSDEPAHTPVVRRRRAFSRSTTRPEWATRSGKTIARTGGTAPVAHGASRHPARPPMCPPAPDCGPGDPDSAGGSGGADPPVPLTPHRWPHPVQQRRDQGEIAGSPRPVARLVQRRRELSATRTIHAAVTPAGPAHRRPRMDVHHPPPALSHPSSACRASRRPAAHPGPPPPGRTVARAGSPQPPAAGPGRGPTGHRCAAAGLVGLATCRSSELAAVRPRRAPAADPWVADVLHTAPAAPGADLAPRGSLTSCAVDQRTAQAAGACGQKRGRLAGTPSRRG